MSASSDAPAPALTVYYFGPAYDVPLFDGATPLPGTPVGQPCLYCTEAIQQGDTGWERPMITMVDGKAKGKLAYAHHECEALGTIGHIYGVCSCTGFDTTSRAAALELAYRMRVKERPDPWVQPPRREL